MYISKIKTKGFRNLSNLDFYPNSGLNVFIGKNGQGKTNFIETIYVASRGKSFRAGNYHEWRSQDLDTNNPATLEFTVSVDKINYSLMLNWTQNQKNVLLNGKKVTSAKLMQIMPTILFSPESLLSIKEGPDKRRNLIDDMLYSSFDQQHFLNQFKKSLKNRNKFLKDCRENQKMDENLYKSMNVLFLNFSKQLTMARINFLLNLEPYVKKALSIIFAEELEYTFEYFISDHKVKSWTSDEIMKLHQDKVQKVKNVECRLGISLVGAHKHDIKFYINGKDSRYYSSQGQQRGLILALKMAEVLFRFKKGEKPILLLDDVLSELDEEKSERLLEFLKLFKTQIFITTTEIKYKEKWEGHYFQVEKGKILSKQDNLQDLI